MHVCIVGAGSLGRVYGARLALDANEGVSFVVRAREGASTDAIRIARVDGEARVLVRPHRVTEVPRDADIVLVCVRADQLDDALAQLLEEGPPVSAVVLSPMLPHDYARLRDRLGERIVAALPSVVAYTTRDAAPSTRYWLPRPATTLIEEPRGRGDAALAELVGALDRAKISARFEMGVHEESSATMIAFLPIAMAIDAAGSVDALLADDALLTLTLRATDEARELAARIGKVVGWASLLLKFVGPLTLRMGVAVARSRAPEGIHYVEEHFVRRAHRQNVALSAAIVALAEEKETPRDALAALAARLGEGAAGVLAST